MVTAAPKMIALVLNSFASATPEQLAQLIQALKSLPQYIDPSAPNTEMTTKAKKKKGKATGGLKRPLNSWMAFRNYYGKMLDPRTQAEKSKILKVLWKADPFEAKWAILAKGYSILRGDRDKEDVPLDRFFSVCCPAIYIITPDTYLNTMGWELTDTHGKVQGVDNAVFRVHTPDMNNFSPFVRTTTYSAENLVQLCLTSSQFPGIDPETTRQLLVSLQMAVQPWAVKGEAAPAGLLGTLGTDLSNLPLAVDTIRTGTAQLNSLGADRDILAFDPACPIDNSWDPNELDGRYEDGDIFNAINLNDQAVTGTLGLHEFDFSLTNIEPW